eukprot:SAG11_NODE_8515_length_1007_cov_1.235683_1_plen_86_part_00
MLLNLVSLMADLLAGIMSAAVRRRSARSAAAARAVGSYLGSFSFREFFSESVRLMMQYGCGFSFLVMTIWVFRVYFQESARVLPS